MQETAKTHRLFNNFLTVVAAGLGLYILFYPFLPQITWKVSPPHASASVIAATTPVSKSNEPVPKESTIIIPSIGLREQIHTGESLSELNKGAWLLPKGSTPDDNSNTVIVGHRFTYTGKGVFYFLDKVKVDELVTIYWEGKEYTYKVNAIKVVPDTEVSVEEPTAEPQLTLYTCTPLWSAKDRLVVTASLEGIYP